ncbi:MULTISPECIES: hypothetical protein [unclassified Gordonia (in: high G+C Gram-positive bacteria)]|uniref:hypothetical protein n=1 Tax=Gordonia sp. B7-2 TaxID=3420932 RepID=UPI003D93A8DC
MQRALRPIATTTIAFASVTALALGPMTTPPALTRDVGIESPAIVPTATWTELVQNTSANLDHLIPVLTADPLRLFKVERAMPGQRTGVSVT